ncbi:MAG: hypothetical protein VX833_01720 [Actinomycetota bacterium]|nr:hypothetical protein [Actinomycetota bacterium]
MGIPEFRRVAGSLAVFRRLAAVPSSTWLTGLIVALSSFFVLWVVNPDGVLLSRSTPTGGDLGAHVWGPAFLRDELLPRFRLSGWAPDWYAGFPAYHFYMVVPMLAIVALNVGLVLPLAVVVVAGVSAAAVALIRSRPRHWVPGLWVAAALIVVVVPVHYGVAFKLVTVVGLVTMPVAGWALGRLAGLPFPGPALTSVATLPFIFDRSFNIMGGNLMSTMAGEFAFALAVSACLVYLGLLVRGMETGRGRGWAAVLLALTGLCHLLVVFFALLATVIALILRPGRGTLRWLVTMGFAAGLSSAFWVLPFLWRNEHLNDMAWEKLIWFRSYLWDRDRMAADFLTNDPPLQPVIIAAVVGALLSILLRRRLGIILALCALSLGLAFVHLPEGRLYNGRLLPAYYLSLYLLAGIAVAEVLRLAGVFFKGIRARPGDYERLITGAGALAATLVLIVSFGLPLRALPGGSMDGNTYRWMGLATEELNLGRSWVRWNFGGYEERTGDATGGGWDELRDLVVTMDKVADRHGCGRLMWEYSSDLTRYGTPMAPMLLPYWTDGCIASMEGLYFESATTTPFHFLIQSELSVGPSRAQRNLPYRSFDLEAGVDHLKQFGVPYYAAFSPDAVAEARTHPGLTEEAKSGPWTIFRVADAKVVAPLAAEPAVFKGVDHGGWLEPAVDVFQEGTSAVVRTLGGLDDWQRIGSSEQPEVRLLPHVELTNIVTEVDKVSFTVDQLGVPVLVRTSYFPNWQVDGAKGPWRATPNLMVVVPTDEDVTLRYGRTPVDLVATLLTLVGLASLWALARSPRPDGPPPAWYDATTLVPAIEVHFEAWVHRRTAPTDEEAPLEYGTSAHGLSTPLDPNQGSRS